MSTLRTTNVIHGSSAITNIVLDNQGRAIFGPDSPAGRAALYVNAQNNRVGVNTETPSVELDVDGQISATGNATIGGALSVSGPATLNGVLSTNGTVELNLGVTVQGADLLVTNQNILVRGSDANGLYIRNGADTTWACQLQGNGRGIFRDAVSVGTGDFLEKLNIYNGSILVAGTPGSNVSGTYQLFKGCSYVLGTTTYGNVALKTTYDQISNRASLEFWSTTGGSNQGVERMRLDEQGRLLVGTSTGQYSSEVVSDTEANFAIRTYNNSGTNFAGIRLFKARGNEASPNIVSSGDRLSDITSYGYDGSAFRNATSIRAEVDGTPGSSDMPGRLVFATSPDGSSSPGVRMVIKSNGNVGINKTEPIQRLDINGNATVNGMFQTRFTDGTGTPRVCIDFFSDYDPVSPGNSNYSVSQIRTTHGNSFNNPEFDIFVDDGSKSNLVRRFRIQKNGSTTIDGGLAVVGALSKTSGSFRIEHPLESKKDTHDLVHSFIEGPQADNIYRSQVTLTKGKAIINLDDEADMTEGTFVLLNTNISCFTSNETDWTAVRGSVTGNILTIEAQDNTSTATVSWLVIGERQDQHMLDTDWTDENGRVITEPLKILQD